MEGFLIREKAENRKVFKLSYTQVKHKNMALKEKIKEMQITINYPKGKFNQNELKIKKEMATAYFSILGRKKSIPLIKELYR